MNTKLTISALTIATLLGSSAFVANASTRVYPLPTSNAPHFYDVQRRFYTEPAPRYREDLRGIDSSMARLQESIRRMNDVLSQYRRDEYGQLRDEIHSFNARVDYFQNLVNHRESPRTLRAEFS